MSPPPAEDSPLALQEKIVLVVGATGLDRLLTVTAYPAADTKVRTTAYHEVGGGNAANTATAIQLLAPSAFLQNDKRINVRTKLISKVGDDDIGKKVIEELKAAQVNLTSPLFRIAKGTTTGFTSIIVSELEQTRTCLHTPGTCGELMPQELADVNMDDIFEHVVHLHSDARHTDVALLLAREARRRGIPVSLDVEKDRSTTALNSLLEVATLVFTNSDQIEIYLTRLNRENEEKQGRQHLKEPVVMAKRSNLMDKDMDLLAYALRPSTFFSRWFAQKEKQVVITKGRLGAISIHCTFVSRVQVEDDDSNGHGNNQVELSIDDDTGVVRVHQTFADKSALKNTTTRQVSADYRIRRAGVLTNLNIIDTTGAGDAFIGGYILTQLVPDISNDFIQASLEFGCWVGGRKLEGPGARSALPKAKDVDTMLGIDAAEIERSLGELLTPFGGQSTETVSLGGSWESVSEREQLSNEAMIPGTVMLD
jgi:sugar/nucleoside kinase (ribokinase family)